VRRCIWRPHGTNANPSRGAIGHTSQNNYCDSVTADADEVVGFDRCLLLFRYSLNVHSRDFSRPTDIDAPAFCRGIFVGKAIGPSAFRTNANVEEGSASQPVRHRSPTVVDVDGRLLVATRA